MTELSPASERRRFTISSAIMPNNEHILLVEDEEHLATGIQYNLVAEGYRVTAWAMGRRLCVCFRRIPKASIW